MIKGELMRNRYDGQAGAAAITLADPSAASEQAFAKSLYNQLKSSGLTVYQMPRLVRFIER
jgi:hypothetical protein